MKRKKWTEEEEETLIRSYSALLSSTSSLLLRCSSRQKKLQQVADRVNSLHHRLRPSSFPFLRSWRDVSVKIHNMRHRYLHAKNRARASSSSSGEEEEAALSLWPNFLLYRQVFGDVGVGDGEDEEEEESLAKLRRGRRRRKKRRTEEKREEEEMEWMERMIAAQAEHERRVVQTHADVCRAQLQVLGALVRVVCQLVRPASTVEDPPQQRRDEDGKDGPVRGAAGYL